MTTSEFSFRGSVPELYEKHLVPLIFAPFAAELVRRLPTSGVTRLLEIAAGTGAVTRAMAAALPESVSIVATDLSPAMLERAAAVGTSRPVEWRPADAMALPFDDAAFDLVVCQFGVMFLPDKGVAFAEARRVLRPGGTFLFDVWDRVEHNEFANTVLLTLARVFPDDPPRRLAELPHGYSDRATIERDLALGGFTSAPTFETVTLRARASSARAVATAYCQGTPMSGEIEARGPGRLQEVTDAVAAALAEWFGDGPIEGAIQAHVVTAARAR